MISNEYETEPTDDPLTLTEDDPTVVVAVWQPDIYDPPLSYKVFIEEYPYIHWEMTWINPLNPNPVFVHVEDKLSPALTVVEDKIGADSGEIWYDKEAHKIVWEGEIPGNGGQVKIWYYTYIPEDVTYIENQGEGIWDQDNDGDWQDEEAEGLDPVLTDDPDTIAGTDPNVWMPCKVKLGNIVWIDTDKDGIYDKDTETGINGVSLNLYADTDGNNIYTPGTDKFVSDTVTFTYSGEKGYYIFENLSCGTYIVQIAAENFTAGALLEGYVSTAGDSDPDNDIDNDDNGYVQGDLALLSYGVFSKAVALTAGDEPVNDGDDNADSNLTVDFGFFREETPPVPCEVHLGNIVWLDTDKDGIYDKDTESGVDGIKLNLYADTDGNNIYTHGIDRFVKSTVTFIYNGEKGYYLFENLSCGTYIVQIAPENFTAGSVLEGYISTAGDSDPDNDTDNDDNGYVQGDLALLSYGVFSKAVTLTAGDEPVNDGDDNADSNLTVDFGFFREETPPVPCEVHLGNIVWLDTDKDGIYDKDTESGVDGIKLNLYADTDGNNIYTPGIDKFIKSTVTFTYNGEKGYYLFENLSCGTYIVQIAAENFTVGGLLEGYISTAGDSDPDNDTDNDDNGYVQDNLAILSYGIFSRAVTLTEGGEPVNDGDEECGFQSHCGFRILQRRDSAGSL